MLAMSSQRMQDLEQSLLTGWVAGYQNFQPRIGIVNLVFQFHQAKSGRTLKRGLDFLSGMVRCSQRKNSVHVESTSTSLSEGPQSFGARELTY